MVGLDEFLVQLSLRRFHVLLLFRDLLDLFRFFLRQRVGRSWTIVLRARYLNLSVMQNDLESREYIEKSSELIDGEGDTLGDISRLYIIGRMISDGDSGTTAQYVCTRTFLPGKLLPSFS